MTRYGYFLSSEEYDPAELAMQARLAQQAGFDGLWISDHFHPWLDEQGQSSFVWPVIGALPRATSLPITTAVTCPIMRMHPALVAQAAATVGLLTNGRFTLGLGTGEALNEHITGKRWPGAEERLEMLEEAVGLIRDLIREWRSGQPSREVLHSRVGSTVLGAGPASADLHIGFRQAVRSARGADR